MQRHHSLQDGAGTPDPGMVDIRYVGKLPAELAGPLLGFELALCCRLSVATHWVGDLVVGADELALVELQESLPILAGQAATMIDRISLRLNDARIVVQIELISDNSLTSNTLNGYRDQHFAVRRGHQPRCCDRSTSLRSIRRPCTRRVPVSCDVAAKDALEVLSGYRT